MKRIRFMSVMMLATMLGATVGWSLDIPLSGGGGGSEATHGGASIGYVDMDKIFQIYPQTQAAKEDYAKQLKKKREQLAEKEAALAEIQSRAAVLESTLKQGAPALPPPTANADGTTTAPSTDPNADPLASAAQSLATMKRELDDKKAEMEDLKKQAAADLAAFEAQQSQLILGKIYQALRDVANEEQVAVVVDKSSILYGDANIDLTDKLQQRVRGY